MPASASIPDTGRGTALTPTRAELFGERIARNGLPVVGGNEIPVQQEVLRVVQYVRVVGHEFVDLWDDPEVGGAGETRIGHSNAAVIIPGQEGIKSHGIVPPAGDNAKLAFGYRQPHFQPNLIYAPESRLRNAEWVMCILVASNMLFSPG